MKKIVLVGMLAILTGCSPDAVVFDAGKTEIVIAEDAPKSVEFAAAEMRAYRAEEQAFGVPLDCRKTYTKADCIGVSGANTQKP